MAWRSTVTTVGRLMAPKRLWRIVQQTDGLIPEPIPTLKVEVTRDGKTLTKELHEDRIKAEAFIKTFASVSRARPGAGHHPNRSRILEDLRSRCQCCRGARTGACAPFTRAELSCALSSLREGKASGSASIPSSRYNGDRKKGLQVPGYIPNEFLVHMPEEVSEQLRSIFNESWMTHEVPAVWRRADVVPILKSDKDPSFIPSYRPVSLTSSLATLMERMVDARLVHLTEKLLPPEQAAFRRHRSAEEQILAAAAFINGALPADEAVVMVNADLARFFDRV
eukprot:Hpha_TRINITY_DN13991_c0_g2::TRINITY_DN13991_c0_g2_i1::g.35812::m.35812